MCVNTYFQAHPYRHENKRKIVAERPEPWYRQAMRLLDPFHLALILVALAGLFSGLYGITGRTDAVRDGHTAGALAESRKVEIHRLRMELGITKDLTHALAESSQDCAAAQQGCMKELAGCR